MIAVRTSGIPSWSIMAFTSLTHITAKFTKHSFPGFRIIQMTMDYQPYHFSKFTLFFTVSVHVSIPT